MLCVHAPYGVWLDRICLATIYKTHIKWNDLAAGAVAAASNAFFYRNKLLSSYAIESCERVPVRASRFFLPSFVPYRFVKQFAIETFTKSFVRLYHTPPSSFFFLLSFQFSAHYPNIFFLASMAEFFRTLQIFPCQVDSSFHPLVATIRFSHIIEWNWNRHRCGESTLFFQLDYNSHKKKICVFFWFKFSGCFSFVLLSFECTKILFGAVFPFIGFVAHFRCSLTRQRNIYIRTKITGALFYRFTYYMAVCVPFLFSFPCGALALFAVGISIRNGCVWQNDDDCHISASAPRFPLTHEGHMNSIVIEFIYGWLWMVASSLVCLSFSLEPTLFYHTSILYLRALVRSLPLHHILTYPHELNMMSICFCLPSSCSVFFRVFFKQIYIVEMPVVIWSPSNFLLCWTQKKIRVFYC